MNNKYLNFSILFIILSFLDIVITHYALSNYPSLHEGNVIMALFTGSFALFVAVKVLFIMVIIGLYRRIPKTIAPGVQIAGKSIIIMLMLFVVSNNIIQIASATTTYGIITPNTLEYPGRVEPTGEITYPFLMTNGSRIQELIVYNSTNIDISTRVIGSAGTIVFATYDWAHPYRIFGVDSSKNVWYTDSIAQVDLSAGFYTVGIWPVTCSNCNPIYKIGVVTTLTPQTSGFVDSNGDFYVTDSDHVIAKFVRSSDFAKTTYLTVAGYSASVTSDIISDFAFDSVGNLHVLIGGYCNGNCAHNYLNHQVYSGSTLLYTQVLADGSGIDQANLQKSNILIDANQTNTTKNIVVAYQHATTTNVILVHQNATGIYDICPSFCATITGQNGLQILDGYAYIASSAENKIYRFPTTIQVSSGNGFVPGIGTGATEAAEIIYVTKTIKSLYSNYYNTSQVLISAKIDADSGYNILGLNYLLDLEGIYRWRIDLIDPNGVVVSQKGTSACVDSWAPLNPTGRCVLTILYQYNAPPNGWMPGSWIAKLYETANGGHVALLTTSTTWNVYNGSMNDNASVIGSPTEPITSDSNQVTIGLLDGYVGLLGFGINSVSKFLFSLLIIVIMFVIGMWKGSGNIGLALSTIPYTFFTYIEYIPKWVFIIYIIMLIMIAKVFR